MANLGASDAAGVHLERLPPSALLSSAVTTQALWTHNLPYAEKVQLVLTYFDSQLILFSRKHSIIHQITK